MITARFIQKEKTLYFLSRSIFINIRSFSINVWSLHPLSVNYALCTISIYFLYGIKVDTFSWYDDISANISYIVLYYCDHDQYSNFNLLHIYSMVTNLMDFSPGVASCRLQCLSDHLQRGVRNFAAGDGHSLLRSQTTTCLSHIETYSRPDAAIVACHRRAQGFISLKSSLPPGQLF